MHLPPCPLIQAGTVSTVRIAAPVPTLWRQGWRSRGALGSLRLFTTPLARPLRPVQPASDPLYLCERCHKPVAVIVLVLVQNSRLDGLGLFAHFYYCWRRYELPSDYSTLMLQYRHGGDSCVPRHFAPGNESQLSSEGGGGAGRPCLVWYACTL